MTEQRLRDLLDHDSADAPPGGVRLADVDARVRGIRRRRGRLAGSVAAAALAVTAVTVLTVDTRPVTRPAPAAGGVWAGALAQPAPDLAQPGLPLFHGYSQGGRRETFTFRAKAEKLSFALTCPPGGYGLVWLNGDLVATGACGPTVRQPPGWVGDATARDGVNEVSAAVVRAADAGTGTMTAAGADLLLARTASYPAEWRLTLVDARTRSCRPDVVRVDPRSGEITARC
ncbi:hypothetical protein [Nonomuraea sp. WAC 01424]|uniref:hypothetical protein n=1 Tax=Nonomuraea sp. WAC 01424 TaxID=2203200 RepID=UPI000F78ECFF|nr:hypothetical protein [Nonomuraea sp. WAC 01424]